MELPDETPEVVPIVCNGILGHFVVRTKTIVNEHFREDKVTVFTKATGTNNPWKTAVHIAAVGVSTLAGLLENRQPALWLLLMV